MKIVNGIRTCKSIRSLFLTYTWQFYKFIANTSTCIWNCHDAILQKFLIRASFFFREMSCEEKVFRDASLSLENFYQANVAIRALKSPSARIKYGTNDCSVLPEYKTTSNGFKQLAYESSQTFDDASHNLRVFAKILRDIDSIQYQLNNIQTIRDCVQNSFDMLNYSWPLFQNLTCNAISVNGDGNTPVKYGGRFKKLI